jgi:MraZ protein
MRITFGQKSKEYLISQERYKEVCITRGQDRRISIFPKPYWDFQKRKLEEMYPDKYERDEMLQLFMPAIEVDLENIGYSSVDIPDELKKWACLENDYIVVARRRRIEIWSRSNYESYDKDNSGAILERGNLKDI